jgi:hypothetical protein
MDAKQQKISDDAAQQFFGKTNKDLIDEFEQNGTIEQPGNKEAALTDDDKELLLQKYYANMDGAHGIPHITTVREAARLLADRTGYRHRNMLDTAALLHDIGNSKDRAAHETIGADMVNKDPLLRRRLSYNQLQALKHAVREHRASTGRPRTQLAKLVADADTVSAGMAHPGYQLLRAYNYGLRHYPELDHEGQLRRAASHIKEKFGPDGYGANALNIQQAQEILHKSVKDTIDAYDAEDIDKLNSMLDAAAEYERKNLR